MHPQDSHKPIHTDHKGSIPNTKVFNSHIQHKKSDNHSAVVVFLKKMHTVAHDFKCACIKVYAWFFQMLAWLTLWPILNLVFNIKITGRENLKNLKGPLIIASNHQRFYDAFLLRISLGLFSKLLPLRFMGTIQFDDPFLKIVKWTGLVHFVYATTGVFIVERGLGLNKNLKRARAILKNNGVVAIMPEGQMNKDGNLTQFKRGVSALALSTHTKVLPIAIKISNVKNKRTKINVHILNAEYLETGDTYENLADKLKNRIGNHLRG